MPQKTAEEVLKNIPFGSKEWYRKRKEVIRRLEDKYDGQYVLAIKGRLMKPDWDIHKQAPIQSWDSEHMRYHFNNSAHFFHEDILYVKRMDVEYNFEYKQINVFAIIRNDHQVVVLKKKSNGELSFPGGHVDFDIDAYRLTPEEILRKSLLMELDEEITNPPSEYVPLKPTMMLNTNNEWNDLFHFGVMYDVYLPECEDLKTLKIKSNEKDKHSVKIVNIDTIQDESRVHQWITLSMNYLFQHEEETAINV